MLSGLPFENGAEVEVIVRPVAEPLALPTDADTAEDILERMRGRVTRYDRPHDPAWDPGDWEMLREDTAPPS